jgi:hypothetical protein
VSDQTEPDTGTDFSNLMGGRGIAQNMLEAMMANGKAIFPDSSTPLDIAEKAKHYDMAAFLKGSGFKRGENVK